MLNAANFAGKAAFSYDNDEDDSGEAESIVSDQGEVHYVDNSRISNRKTSSSWLAQLKSRANLAKPQEGSISHATKCSTRKKNETISHPYPHCSSNLIQRLDDLFRVSSEQVPLDTKRDEPICHPDDGNGLIEAQPAVQPVKIFDLRSLKVASNKGQAIIAVQSKPALCTANTSASWRVNDWLTKSFPPKPRQDIFPRKMTNDTGDNEDREVQDDIECDELGVGPFCSPPSLSRGQTIQDDIMEDDCDGVLSLTAQMESRDRTLGLQVDASQSNKVSIRDLFKGAGKNGSCTRRDHELTDLGSSKRRRTPANRQMHRNECNYSPGFRSPPTRRKSQLSSVLRRSDESPLTTSGSKKLDIDITEFSDEEVEAQASMPPEVNFNFLSLPAEEGFDEVCTADEENASAIPEVPGKNHSSNLWLTRLHDVGSTAQGAMPKGRYGRRVRGEFSRLFHRYEERHEADYKLFRMKLDRGGTPAVSCIESKRPWHVQVLQKQFCGPLVACVVQVLRGLRNTTVSQSVCCNLLLSGAAMKTTSALINEGSILRIYHPWTIFHTSFCQLPTVLCSERLLVMGQLLPGEDIRNIVDFNDDLQIPHELIEPPASSGPERDISRIRSSIYDFRALKSQVEQVEPCPPCPSVMPAVSISDIDSWVSRPTIQGRVVKACPRGLLLRAAGSSPTRALPEWMNSLEDAAASSPSSFWCADSSGMACEIFVPCEFENVWSDILLSPSDKIVRVSDLCVLGRARRLCPENAAAPTGFKGNICGGSVLQMSPYVLQVTSHSIFEYPSRDRDTNDAPRPCQRPTSIRCLIDRGTRSSGSVRSTVIVHVARILTPEGIYSEDETRPTLDLCVWDSSLAQAGAPVRTILLRIAEPAQCLSSAGVLSVGHTILVRDVSVEWFETYTLGGPWVELTVDGNSQVWVCTPEDNAQCICTGEFGFCLPSVSRREIEELVMEKRSNDHEREVGNEWNLWPEAAPSLREPSAGIRDALLEFSGAIICVRSGASIMICPSCGSREVHRMGGRPAHHDSRDSDRPGFSCAACEILCSEPVCSPGPVYAGLDTGDEVLISGALLERILAAAAAGAGMRRWSVDGGVGLLVGCKIRGICIRRRLCAAPMGNDCGEHCSKWELRAVEVLAMS